MKPIVTIGMCMRNSENTIANALDSIINQDFPHKKMQAIFVDDGSTDKTYSILKKYIAKMNFSTKVFQTKWQGLGPARNLIANKSDGEYIIWVDADEVLMKNYVSKQVEFMEKNPKVGITVGVVKLVPRNLVLNLELIPVIVNHFQHGKPSSFLWRTNKLPGTGGATYRVEALKQVNGFNPDLRGVGEDQDVAHRIQNKGWLIQLNYAQFYEFHGGMSNFKHLWIKYVWYGIGSERIYRQNRTVFSLVRMSPIAGFLTGALYLPVAYQVLSKKMFFLLPMHYGIKMTGWMFGFMRGQFSRMLDAFKK